MCPLKRKKLIVKHLIKCSATQRSIMSDTLLCSPNTNGLAERMARTLRWNWKVLTKNIGYSSETFIEKVLFGHPFCLNATKKTAPKLLQGPSVRNHIIGFNGYWWSILRVKMSYIKLLSTTKQGGWLGLSEKVETRRGSPWTTEKFLWVMDNLHWFGQKLKPISSAHRGTKLASRKFHCASSWPNLMI